MAPEIAPERLQAFLDELTALTQRYGLVIGGCGHCGSPWVSAPDLVDDDASRYSAPFDAEAGFEGRGAHTLYFRVDGPRH